MRHTRRLLVLLAIVVVSGRCSHNDMTTNPGPVPVVADIQPSAEVVGGVLIIAGTHFDQTATFDLRQGSNVKATLTNLILASDDPAKIQINGTIPTGTPVGKYQVCVTTKNGVGCGPALVEVF
ncbi:MAG TPA: hypothetical protein VGK26_07530 [Thermoanaerobaculia bacterium]|jgi:hypothetical protein